MGAPYFKYKEILKKNKVHVFSSNYSLYGDISARVMQTIHKILPDIQIYSIDEAFSNVKGMKNLEKEIINAKKTIEQWTGIPVSIGVAPTKTLAKMANEIAKKNPEHNGTLIFKTAKNAEPYFANFSVGKIWGIGRGYSQKLFEMQIYNTSQLLKQSPSWIKAHLNSPGISLINELRGIKSTRQIDKTNQRKSIICSRSFGKKITKKESVLESISFFADNAATRLRKEGLVTNIIKPYFYTSRFEKNGKYYASKIIHLIEGTNDSTELINECKKMVNEFFKPNFCYAKAGIACFGIEKQSKFQLSLFSKKTPEQKNLMTAYDAIRTKYGKGSLILGSTGLDKSWWMRQQIVSHIKLTDPTKLPTVKA